MKYLHLTGNNPWFNLATDEYLLRNSEDDYFILSVNDPCVVIGKHQVANEESNCRFITENSIPVIRRISGGGTVYHDRGNVNFSIIRSAVSGKQINFELYTRPVVGYLESLGVKAVFGGKNDLRCDGEKISGNAEHVYRNRVLHHGTLLFDTDLEALNNSIAQGEARYEGKSVKSNRTNVTNLKKLLPVEITIEEFIAGFGAYLRNSSFTSDQINLNEETIKKIESLATEKYKTWEWNHEWGPAYTAISSFNHKGEVYNISLHVKGGIIVDCTIGGGAESQIFCNAIRGRRHNYQELTDALGELTGGDTKKVVYSLF